MYKLCFGRVEGYFPLICPVLETVKVLVDGLDCWDRISEGSGDICVVSELVCRGAEIVGHVVDVHKKK